jgi:hypothetical protein
VPGPGSLNLTAAWMALHSVADFRNVGFRVRGILSRRGWFAFSVEHPVDTADPGGRVYDGRLSNSANPRTGAVARGAGGETIVRTGPRRPAIRFPAVSRA